MAVCFSEDSALLAAGVVMGKALLWSVETGQKTLEISVCKGPVFCGVLRRHAEQMLLATGDVAGNACIYDPFTGELQKKIACGSPVSARHAPCDDSSTRCHTCRLTVWPSHSVAASCSKFASCIPTEIWQVRGLDLSADGRRLATGTAKGHATVWNARTGSVVTEMRCSGGMVYSVCLRADYLATGDQHKMAKLWEVSTGTLMQTFLATEVVKKVDISADLSLVACGAGNQSLLFDMESGGLVQKKVRRERACRRLCRRRKVRRRVSRELRRAEKRGGFGASGDETLRNGLASRGCGDEILWPCSATDDPALAPLPPSFSRP